MIQFERHSYSNKITEYNAKEVVDELQKVFYSICYLCEEKTRHVEVDHFFPKSYFPDKKTDWDNLFIICNKCNKLKGSEINSKPNQEILNPCVDDVESLIGLSFDRKIEEVIIETEINSIKIENTKNLLNNIYNGKKNSTYRHRDLQRTILIALNEFEQVLERAKEVKDELKETYFSKIEEHLDKKSNHGSFISFKKSLLKNHKS